jgi:hypothetical protein
MTVISLVDESARSALDHATSLHARMRGMGRSTDPQLRECYARMHELVGDLASIRNATQLLKNELDAADDATMA